MKKIIKITEADLAKIISKVIEESDPKSGSGKKPKGSDRRLYTDENPNDTVSVKFRTKQDIIDTLSKDSFKSKPHARQSQIINLIERLDITTEDGKLVYSFNTIEQDGSGSSLFNNTTFKPIYEVIDNSYVVYSRVDENSDMIQKLKQFTKPGKVNKFIVSVTPRLSSDLLKTGSKLFTTKPNILIVQ